MLIYLKVSMHDRTEIYLLSLKQTNDYATGMFQQKTDSRDPERYLTNIIQSLTFVYWYVPALFVQQAITSHPNPTPHKVLEVAM